MPLAQPGNRHAAKGKSWRDSLRKSLKLFESKELGVERGKALRKISDRVVEQALKGDKDCWQEIANRLDGKPAQAITGPSGEPISLVERVIVMQTIDAHEGETIEGETVQERLSTGIAVQQVSED